LEGAGRPAPTRIKAVGLVYFLLPTRPVIHGRRSHSQYVRYHEVGLNGPSQPVREHPRYDRVRRRMVTHRLGSVGPNVVLVFEVRVAVEESPILVFDARKATEPVVPELQHFTRLARDAVDLGVNGVVAELDG